MADAGSMRLPDFVVIGAMKAGTTSLFRWLGTHPGCDLPEVKEPHFFSRDDEYARGIAAYRDYFAATDPALLTGEASASYADPRIAGVVAERLHAAVPSARLVYLVRHPGERLKSHFLHERQRSRERRSLPEALADPANPYVALSCYADAVTPFLRRFGSDAVLLLHLADLAGADAPGWDRLTDFLGLDHAPGTDERANETRSKVAFNPLLLKLWEAGWLERVGRLPGPVRRAGRAVLGRSTASLQDQALEVRDLVLPDPVQRRLTEQWAGVHELLGAPAPPLDWTSPEASR
ncbi:sulfotransferase domain-containing protein [Nocardioides euryhalodurans]|uniref:sulfotransferase domain-containing protein n=1 Tax=Nocardioides euryhalodurans TaxID=2518370 RepID=UPI00141DD23F|nr:sulfotransferase [Nocardioides euryhalodurans]